MQTPFTLSSPLSSEIPKPPLLLLLLLLLLPPIPKTALANLTVDCTGAFSRLRKKLGVSEPVLKSHFVALLLKDCPLPYPNYGYVTLADPAPVLCYQIATNEIRMLIAVPDPLPSASNGDLKRFIQEHVVPQLPDFFHEAIERALEEQIRSTPCRILPTRAVERPGGFSLGDSLNMRHPLTGGGMTVAFSDVVLITRLLEPLDDLSDRHAVSQALRPFYSSRKNAASTINILSVALYDVFCGSTSNPALGPMQEACFDYFPYFGTDCLSMVAGLQSNPFVLAFHFFAVAFFTVFRLIFPFPTLERIQLAAAAFSTAYMIFKPLLVDNYLSKPVYTYQESTFVKSGENGKKSVHSAETKA